LDLEPCSWAFGAVHLPAGFTVSSSLSITFSHVDALGFGAVVDEHAVAQGAMSKRTDVFLRDMGAALEEGADLGTEHENCPARKPAPQLTQLLM